MPQPKTRTSAQVYDALKKISDEEGVDFGLDDYSQEDFNNKYFTGPGNIENLYNNLSKISDEEGIDFGQGSRDEWLASFGYRRAPGDTPSYLTLDGRRVGGPSLGYSARVEAAHSSPTNVAPHYKDRAQIAGELGEVQGQTQGQQSTSRAAQPAQPTQQVQQSVQETNQAQAQQPVEQQQEAQPRDSQTSQFTYRDTTAPGGIPVTSYFAPVGVNLEGDWKDKTVKVGDRDARAGDISDALYEEARSYYDTARNGAAYGDETMMQHILRRAEDWGIKDAEGDDWQSAELRRAIADKSFRRFYEDKARELARKTVSAVPTDTKDVNTALYDAFYRRDLQDEMRDMDTYSGISYASFINNFVKPAMVEEGKRTGKDISKAVNGLFRQPGIAEEKVSLEEEIRQAEEESKRLNELLAKRIEELEAKHEDTSLLSKAVEYANSEKMVDAGVNPTGRWSTDEEYQNLTAALAQVRERIKVLTARRDDKGFWGGVKDAVSDPNTWMFSIPEMANTMSLMRVKGKMEAGEQLSASEQSLLDNAFSNNQAQSYYGDMLNDSYRWGGIAGYALPFVGQFIATGGGYSALNAGAKLGARAAAKVTGESLAKDASRWILRNLGVLADDVGSAALMANTVGFGRTASDTMSRHMGTLTKDENGKYVFKDGKSWGRSIYEAEVANTLEYYTEKLGAHTEGLQGAITGSLTGGAEGWLSKGVEALGLSKLSKAISRVNGSDFLSSTRGILRKGGIQEYPGEVLEEEANILLNSMLVGDNKFSDLWDNKTQGDIWGGMLYSIVLMQSPGIIGGVYQTGQYYRYKHNADKADRKGSALMGEERWSPWRSRIDETPNDNMGVLVNEVIEDKDLDIGQKKAITNYIGNLVKMRAYNMLTTKEAQAEAEEGTEDAVAQEVKSVAAEAYTKGYNIEDPQEKVMARIQMENARKRLGEVMSEEMIGSLEADGLSGLRNLQESGADDEVMALSLDYVNARAIYDGMEQRVADDIDTEVAVMEAQVDDHVAKEDQGGDGMIHPATLKIDDRQVYVVSGHVVMTDDGTMVNMEASDDAIIVKDAQTGKLEFVSAHDIRSVGTVTDPAQEKARLAEEIRSRMTAESEADISGEVMPGRSYTVTFEDEDHSIEVLSDNGDGTLEVRVDGREESQPMSREQLQDMVDAKMKEQGDEQGDGGTLPEPAVPESEGVVSGAPAEYVPDMELTIRDEDGSEKPAMVMGRVRYENGSFVPDANGNIIEYFMDGEVKHDHEDKLVDKVVSHVAPQQPEAAPVQEASAEAPATVETTPPPVEQQAEVAQQPVQEPVQTVEPQPAQPAEAPAQPTEQPTAEPMPVGEDGEEDWQATTPERAHAYIFNEAGLSRSEGNEFIAAQTQAAQSALVKAKSAQMPRVGTSIKKYNEAKAKRQEKIDEAQRVLDYWQQVRNIQNDIQRGENERRAAEDAVRHDEAVAEAQAEYEARKQAEAERKAVGNENPMPAITEKWNNATKVDGHRDEIMLPDGTPLKGHYVLHESGASSPSHNPETWQKTDGFPMDANDNSVNDRDYERDHDAQEHTQSIARQYDQRALQSVPVVSNDGVVLSGNGRTMAGELAARDNTDGAYVNYLKEYAPKFGFTPEQVGAMQHPRVSFVPDEAMPYTAETFAKFNQQEMKSQNKTEQAVKLGKTVSDDSFKGIVRTINGYDTLGDFYNDAEASLGAVYDLHNAGVVPQAQLAEMVDGVRGQEKLSAVGREFLENMLIGKAFDGDPDAVRMLTAEPSMRQAVITALGEIADNIALGDGWSLQEELSKAVKLCFEARQDGAKHGDIVSVYSRQTELAFDDIDALQTVADFNNATMLMLADVLNDKRVTLLKTTLQLYNHDARESASGQGDLFAGGVRSREDILRNVIKYINDGKRKELEAARAAAVERRKAESVVPGDKPGGTGIQQNGTPPAVGGEGADAGRNADDQQGDSRLGSGRQGALEASVTDEERTAMQARIVDWLSDENLSAALGKSRTEIFDLFGNTLEPIAYIPSQYLPLISKDIKDPRIYCGMGYFIDHALRNHGLDGTQASIEDVDVSKYLNIQAVLDNPDAIKETYVDGKRTVVFVKKIGRYFAELTQVEDDGKIILHKSLFSQKKEPYAKLNDIRSENSSSEDGVSSISHAAEATPAISLQSRGDDMSDISAGKGSEKSATVQGKGEKVAENQSPIQGLDGYTEDEVLSLVRGDIEEKLADAGIDGLTIKGMALHGSRLRGDASEDSDLDVVVEYEGDMSEDGLFNILNDEPMEIEGVRVDVNPITRGKSGTLDQYMERSRQYDALKKAERETNTEPTEAQKEAGNYKKGHVKMDGYDVTIENPKGSVRRGTDASGKQWEQEMQNTYGYIRGTEGVDGDHIDVFFSDDPSQGDVFVVDQVNKDGSFDEHKVMYGFPDIESARKAYLSNYEDGWQGLGAITPVSKEEFKKWIDSSHRKTKPFAEYSSVKPLGDTQLGEQPNKPTVKAGEDYVSAAERIAKEHEVKRTAAHFAEETQEEATAFDKRVPEMDDAELLAYMQEDGKGNVNKAHHPSVYDEYDYRHGDEQADAYDRYLQQLQDNGTTLEQAEEMLATLQRDMSRLATDERAELLGQEEALQEYIAGLEKVHFDKQGNPVDADGNLILEEIRSVDDLTGEDFSRPSRNVQLPKIPEVVDKAIGANGKPVIIKKNIFEKNKANHPELKPSQSRKILKDALYSTNLYGQTQPKSRPNYWVVIHTSDPNRVVVLEVSENKDNVEIVGWRYAGERQLEELRKQAEREDGQLLILTSEKEAAAGLSTLPSDVSAGKDNTSSSNLQGKAKEFSDRFENAVRETLAAELKESPTDDKGEIEDLEKYIREDINANDESDLFMEVENYLRSLVGEENYDEYMRQVMERERKDLEKRYLKRFNVKALMALDAHKDGTRSDDVGDAVYGIVYFGASIHQHGNKYDLWLREKVHGGTPYNPYHTEKHKSLTEAKADKLLREMVERQVKRSRYELTITGTIEEIARIEDRRRKPEENGREKGKKIADKNWVLTAFEKKNSALDNTTDTGKTSDGGKRNDTATPQSTVSIGKDSDLFGNVQGKNKKSSSKRIDDFGEKIGGARKDMARSRIRDTKKMTVKDLTTLKKGADDVLSQANIMRFYKEGQMDEQTARSFLAFSKVAKEAMKHASQTSRELVMTKYRDAAVAWEEGMPVVFEVTDKDVKAYQSQFGVNITEEKVRESLDYAITDPFNMFIQTYKAIDYPAVERKLGQYVIVDYTSMKGRHVVLSRPFWVKNGLRAQRGYPFATMESAVAKLKKLCPEVTEKEKKTRGEKSEHGLHVTKEGYGFYIKSRNIPGSIYLSPKFWSEKDAQKYLDDNLERLKEREQRLVDALMGSNIGMAEREGVDYRNGKDVTPRDFLDEFGFRGVEFGNWVPQGERQMYLNKTYDAIKDFCAIVGISPRAFSLGGRLGLAFGARGKSRAMAHYEPGKEVINLTRMSGVGSLAHEWFHALDNYLAKQKTGNMSDMATETHDVVREELGDVFKEMFNAMRALDYDKRSRRAGEYWGRTEEEFARLFENYIYNKLAAKETISPVLVRQDALLDDVGEDLKKSWPYPSSEENAKMEPFFDKLFDTIQEKTDANGNVVLYEPSFDYRTKDGGRIKSRSLFDEMGLGDDAEVAMVSQQTEQGSDASSAFAPSDIRLRKLKKGETCHVERVYEETKQFDFTGYEKVESAEDVAYIFRQLENAAVENSFLVLVKDGRPTVIHLGVGSYVNVMAPYEQALVAYRELKPEQVYFVHNHPSGVLKASRQDQELLKRVKMAFGEDVVQQGIIIDTTSGKYGEFDMVADNYDLVQTSGVEAMPQSEGADVPVKVYQFSRQVFAPDWNPENAFKIDSSQSVAEFVSSHRLGEHKKMSFLVVNNSGNVVANVFLPWTKLSDIKRSKDAGDLLAGYVHQCGGVRGVLYGNYDYEADDRAVLAAVGGRMRQLNAPLMDALHVEHSAYESGWAGVGEPGDDYSISAHKIAIDDRVAQREYLLSDNYVSSLTGDEFAKSDKPLTERVAQFYADNYDGKVERKGLGTVILDKRGVKDSLSHGIGRNKAAAFAAVPDIIRNGVLIDQKENWKNRKYDSYTIAAPIEIAGEGFVGVAIVTRGHGTNTNKFYLHEVVLQKNLLDESIKTDTEADSHRGDVAKVLKEIVTAKENGENVTEDTAKYREDEEDEINSHTDEDILLMRSAVQQMGEKLHTDINIIEDVNEITHPNAEIEANRRRAKGWYDRVTRQVYVVLPNNRDIDDAKVTAAHEVIAHKGLRELVGEENYDEFLDETYQHLRDDLKKGVDAAAGRAFIDDTTKNGKRAKSYEQHRRTAVDELFGRMAEKPFEEFSEGERTLWQKIKATVRRLLDKFLGSLKLPKWFELGDNELRYILWRSKERLERGKEHPIDLARDIVKREELGLTDEARYNMGDAPETFKARQRRAVENRGTVMPGLNGAKFKVVEVPRHQYQGRDVLTQARDAAIDRYSSIGDGKKRELKSLHYDNLGTTFDYVISPKSLTEAANHASDSDNIGVHAAVMDKLDKVINESIEIEEHPDIKKKDGERKWDNGFNKGILMHRFAAAVRIGDEIYRVKTTMKEYENPQKANGHYTYEVTKIEVLDEQSNTPNGRSNVSDVFVSGAKLLNNLEKSYDSGKKILDESKIADESTDFDNPLTLGHSSELDVSRSTADLYRDPDETEDISPDGATSPSPQHNSRERGSAFGLDDIWNDQSLGLQERKTAAATRLANNHREDKTLRNDAMRVICDNLADLAKSMLGRPRKKDLTDAERRSVDAKVGDAARAQKRFDQTTVKRVADLARVLISSGHLNGLSAGEVKRLLSAVKNSVGHDDIEGDVQKVMDIMVDNQLKNAKADLESLEAIKGSKVDARGVEVQGELDLAGQVMMKAFKDGRRLKREALEEEIGKALDRMSSESESVREDAENAYAGLQFAMQYADRISDNKHAEKVLRDELKKKRDETSERDRMTDSYRQYVVSMEDAIRQKKIERAQAYHDLVAAMTGSLRESMANAKAFKESERKRVESIRHFANSDMQGMELRGQRPDSRLDRWNESLLLRFGLSPLHTFDQFMRLFGRKNADGKGYLYDHYVRKYIDSADHEQLMKEKYEGKLEAKVKELFGTHKVAVGLREVPYTYTSLYGYVDALPMTKVTYYDGAGKREYELSQAQLAYLYMVDKMPMGKATNRGMGVTEEVIKQIEGSLDAKLKEFADWVQEEFLVELGNECNEVHKRMFGANMDSIENYFPFVRDKNSIKREVENGAGESMAERISTKTGAIIKRTPSVANWDMPNANFLDVLAKHVSEMCQWSSYAELNRDLGTLQSFNRFKQQVLDMRTIYGSGEQLWKRFMQTCAIAGNAYEPKRGEADKLMVQGAKGVVMGKIAFRPMTAMKQLLSLPAFFGEVDMECLSRDFATGGIASVKWAWENMPNFRKRIKSRTAGDFRLSATKYDKEKGWTNTLMRISAYGMLPNIGVDAWTIALGSHAVYVKAKKKYLRQGYSEEKAERRAVQDAELCFNKSQQSSEGAFMAPVQIDHTFACTTMMLFRNSSTSYTRECVTSVRNLKRMMSGEVDVDFMAKQILRNAEIPTFSMLFDAELQRQVEGTLPVGHIYSLGMPGGVLQSAGFPDVPIELSSTRLAEKSSDPGHPFPIEALKGLVDALNNPVAVFNYGNNAMNVIVGLEYKGKHFLVGVHFNQQHRGTSVSDIRGLFPKDNAEWLNWISQGKARYLDHKRIKALIAQQRINLAEVDYLDLKDVAKVMKSFVNPAIPEQKYFAGWRAEDVERAREQARKEYRSGYIRNSVNAVMFGFILPWLWRIGGLSILLTLGDDDDDKVSEVKKASKQSLFGPLEGIAYGDVIAEGLYVSANNLFGDGTEKFSNLGRTNPFVSDLADVLRKLDGDKLAAVNDVLNMLVGMKTGVNLQTVSDWATAILDYSPDGDTSREVSLLVSRLLNAPQSQIEKIYFDEIGMSGDEALRLSPRELVERYAQYKVKREHFVTPWVWGDEALLDKKRKRGKTIVKERTEQMGDKHVNEAYQQYEEVYKGVDAKVKEAKKTAKTDYVEAAQLMAEAQSDPNAFATYQMFKQMDGNFNKIVKFYLGAKTPDEAALCRQAVLDYKSAMVKVLEAPDAATRAEAMNSLGTVMQGFTQKYIPMQQPNR